MILNHLYISSSHAFELTILKPWDWGWDIMAIITFENYFFEDGEIIPDWNAMVS